MGKDKSKTAPNVEVGEDAPPPITSPEYYDWLLNFIQNKYRGQGVTGVIIMDNIGRAIRSTMDDETTAQHSILLHQLCDKSKGTVKELDASNDLTFIRLRTRKNEIFVAPEKDYLYAVIKENPAKGAAKLQQISCPFASFLLEKINLLATDLHANSRDQMHLLKSVERKIEQIVVVDDDGSTWVKEKEKEEEEGKKPGKKPRKKPNVHTLHEGRGEADEEKLEWGVGKEVGGRKLSSEEAIEKRQQQSSEESSDDEPAKKVVPKAAPVPAKLVRAAQSKLSKTKGQHSSEDSSDDDKEVELLLNSLFSLFISLNSEELAALVQLFCKLLTEKHFSGRGWNSSAGVSVRLLSNLFRLHADKPELQFRHRELCRMLHGALCQDGRHEQAAEMMATLLRTYTDADAESAREDVGEYIRNFVIEPRAFYFDHLLDLSAVKSLEQTDPLMYAALAICENRSLPEYHQFTAQNPTFAREQLSVDEKVFERKIKMLTLISLAERKQHHRLAELSKQLDIGDEEELEAFLLDAIRAQAINGKIDGVNSRLTVTFHQQVAPPPKTAPTKPVHAKKSKTGQHFSESSDTPKFQLKLKPPRFAMPPAKPVQVQQAKQTKQQPSEDSSDDDKPAKKKNKDAPPSKAAPAPAELETTLLGGQPNICKLSSQMLASASPQKQKQMVSERLYPLVAAYCGSEDAGKITGMMLEMNIDDILALLEDEEAVRGKVSEAVAVLQATKGDH